MYEYFLVSFVFIFVFIFAYIKIKYPFWNNQPVFHSYDYWRFLYTQPYIVYKKHPIKTKYCDFENIKTIPFSESTTRQREQITNLLQCYYIPSEQIIHTLLLENLEAHLTGHNEPTFVSVYYMPAFMVDNNEIIHDKMLLGSMCSRPMKLLYVTASPSYHKILLYYLDYLCIHREHDNLTIGRKLFQTHEYNQRVQNPSISISLFKKENAPCVGIIPLVEYKTFTYSLRNIIVDSLPDHVHIVRIFVENVDLLFDFLTGLENQDFIKNPILFSIYCITDMGSLLSLIKTQLLFVFCLRNGEHIYGWYFIKNPKIQYEHIETGGQTLQCIASIMNCNSGDLFYLGFVHSLRAILKLNKRFSILLFENISHNTILLNHWKRKHSFILENQTSYYLYNFIMPGSPISAERVFVL